MLSTIRRHLRPVKRAYRVVRTSAIDAARAALSPLMISTTRSVYGTRFKIPLIRSVGLEHLGGSELWMSDLIRRLLSGGAFIDVGVNVGQTLLKVKSIDPAVRYLGFEPNPFCVLYSNELVRLNDFRECEIFPIALSDAPALLELVGISEADSGGSMLTDLRPGRPIVRKQRIPAFDFDGLGLDTHDVQLVKIDVEGAESRVLAGMKNFLKATRPCVICEVLHAHDTSTLPAVTARNEGIVALLHEIGYSIFRVRKGADRVYALEAISNFPKALWMLASSPELCDYLFVPIEKAACLEAEFSNSPPDWGIKKSGSRSPCPRV
jgi:FkbM family methyltransferase